jgi:mycothiol synthase
MLTVRRALAGLVRRATWMVAGQPQPEALLEMVWPESRIGDPPDVVVANGYRLRQYEPADRAAYFTLLASAGMDPCRLEYWEQHLLPEGFFVIEHTPSKTLVATCMASHHPALRHPRAGNLGWLAADPAHGGRGLGRAAAAAVTARLVAGGYRRIYLETHDFRLAAIRVYLSMGWVPLLYQEDMQSRWQAVHKKLGLPFVGFERYPEPVPAGAELAR